MSYCRFSSDDWRSDLYVYESAEGWVVHVAGRRAIVDRSTLPEVTADRDTATSTWFAQWHARHMAMSALLDGAEYADIGLPHDGDTGVFDTPSEAADAIEWLAAVGYHVPDGVVGDLRSEAVA